MSNKHEGQNPAYPIVLDNNLVPYYGMTIRDYFAITSLSGLLAADSSLAYLKLEGAQQAYEMADAMLAARDKR